MLHKFTTYIWLHLTLTVCEMLYDRVHIAVEASAFCGHVQLKENFYDLQYISIDKCHLLQDRTPSVHDKLSVFVTPFPPKINISYQAWVVEIVSLLNKMIRKLTFNQLS